MRCAILGFAGGAACLQMQAVLPQASTLAALAVVALLLACLRGAPRAAAAGALCGFCWAAVLAQNALAQQLASVDEGRDIVLVGTIDSLPYRFAEGVRFNFAVEKAAGATAPVPVRVSLAWYAAYRNGGPRPPEVQPGERWQLAVRLQRPHGNANPHGFDYEVWLLEQGVRATGYVRNGGVDNRLLVGFVVSFRSLVEHCRATLRRRIEQALPTHAYAGVIVALVVGDQRSIGQSDWEVFNRTGIGHLISISGLHITMVAGAFAVLASALWRRSFFTAAQLPLRLPAQKAAALCAVVVALLYVLLAGFGVPAQRTLYMLAVVAAAAWSGRMTSLSHVLSAALGMVVLLDPWAVLAPGFWLSFGAVAVLLYATAGRIGVPDTGWRGALRLGVHTQYAITIGLVPLTMLLFSQVSLVSPLANALAIPLISFVVTPLSLVGSLLPSPLSALLLSGAHAVVEALAIALGWLGQMRYAVWAAPAPQPWVFAFALIGTVWMLAPRGWPLRWLGIASWLPLLAAQPTSPAPGQMIITAFDVGQGMALLVETHRHRLLYDTGPAYSIESNGGNRVIVPYLKGRGIGTLDVMVVSHGDADHAGGAMTVLAAVRVKSVVSSLAPQHPIARAGPRHSNCVAGQRWEWDSVAFEMLHPTGASYSDAAQKPNARSCTLRISAAGKSVLLAGDIEARQEAELLARDGKLSADVLLAPHHGSGTSSTPAFLAAVKPALVVFQVGHRNRYRHPKQEVVERYRKLGIARVRTDEFGALTLASSDALQPHGYRSERARYWYGK